MTRDPQSPLTLDAGYPTRASERDRWILSRRPARQPRDPRRPYSFQIEEERAEDGEVVPVTTVFLTNRECPWRCLMCDLWQHTLTDPVSAGAIPEQIDFALRALEREAGNAGPGQHRRAPARRQLKLYNSGSFFDPRAIPPEDHPAIAARAQSFERVIVECHPALVGDPVGRFRDRLDGRLEVAMGLETAHPEVLEKLNKRMTLEQFRHAADFLREHDIALRVFLLVKPPFLDEATALHWARRSLDFAFDGGATVASLIPTRAGNGALEALAQSGDFAPPKLATLEAAAAYGMALGRGRVFADLWDLEKFSNCATCFPLRRARLHEMNVRQLVPPPVACPDCAAESRAGESPDVP